MSVQTVTLSIAAILSYPKLNRPDSFEGGAPEFKTAGIIVDSDKNRAKIGQLTELLDNFISQQTAKRLQTQEFFYENEDGTLEIRFKNKVYARKSDESLFSMPIMVVDASGKPYGSIEYDAENEEHAKGVPSIGQGTKALISFEARPFKVGNKVGLSLRMKGLKIVELVEYTGGANFDDDDDEFAEAPTSSSSTEGDDDFL
jgi:hypothetical protein